MGKIKKWWKKNKRKALKPIISTAIGATLGFIVGGPVGVVSCGIASLTGSLKHDYSIYIGTNNVPIYKTEPIEQKQHTNQSIDQTINKNNHNMAKTDILNVNENIDIKHNVILTALGKIFEKSDEFVETYEELINGHELNPNDTHQLIILKNKVNNLLDLIES